MNIKDFNSGAGIRLFHEMQAQKMGKVERTKLQQTVEKMAIPQFDQLRVCATLVTIVPHCISLAFYASLSILQYSTYAVLPHRTVHYYTNNSQTVSTLATLPPPNNGNASQYYYLPQNYLSLLFLCLSLLIMISLSGFIPTSFGPHHPKCS